MKSEPLERPRRLLRDEEPTRMLLIVHLALGLAVMIAVGNFFVVCGKLVLNRERIARALFEHEFPARRAPAAEASASACTNLAESETSENRRTNQSGLIVDPEREI